MDLGFTAMKFDPFGDCVAGSERLRGGSVAISLVEAVRDEVGPGSDLMIEAHGRFGMSAALRIAERLAPFRPAWFEEPVSHHNIPVLADVARRSPVPVAAGESFSALHQFAELLATGAVGILQPEPVHLGGLWRTRQAAALAEAGHAVVAPHNAQGPICSAVSAQLAACVPNFYVQESFDSFNEDWTRDLVDPPISVVDGYIETYRKGPDSASRSTGHRVREPCRRQASLPGVVLPWLGVARRGPSAKRPRHRRLGNAGRRSHPSRRRRSDENPTNPTTER